MSSCFFFCKQKTAYGLRISDWSSDVCSSDLQAAELFNELSSAEIYGSLAAVDQNAVFGQTLDMLTNRRSFGGDFATQLWLNTVGNWAKYGDGDAYGASDIRANSYGIAGGLDFA